MPERENPRKKRSGSGKPEWKRTDKAVHAEMKNKLETARLHMQKKFFDRQCTASQWMVEKEKRQAVNAFRRMRNTSGVSREGRAPDGPTDRKHETSPYFRCQSTLGEKRLQKWRSSEKELERELALEQLESLPWEKGSGEEAKENFGRMMRLLGYDVDDDAVERAGERRKSGSQSASTTRSDKSQENLLDVFQCLRLGRGNNNDVINDDPSEMKTILETDVANGDAGRQSRQNDDATAKPEPVKTPLFSARAWEKQYINDYLSTITSVSARPHRDGVRCSSASGAMRRHHSESRLAQSDSRPSTGQSYSTRGGGLRHAWTDEDRESKQYGVHRQHSKDSVCSATGGQKLDRVVREGEGGAVPSPRVTVRPHSVQGIVRRKGGATRPVSAGNWDSQGIGDRAANSGKHNTNLGKVTESHGYRNKDRTNGLNVELNDVSVDRDNGVNKHVTGSGPEVGDPDRNIPVNGAINGEQNGDMTDRMVSDDEAVLHEPQIKTKVAKPKAMNRGVSCSATPLSNTAPRRGSKVSFANDAAQGQVKDKKGEPVPAKRNKNRRRHTLGNLALGKKLQRRRSDTPTDQSSTTAYDADGEEVEWGVEKIDTNSNVEDDEDQLRYMYGDEQTGDSRRMSRWRRDLLMEAPPGIFTSKEPIKVALVMSKAKRQRELERLVDDNRADSKKIANYERSRRLSNRLNVYMTMSKLDEAATIASGIGTVEDP